MTESADKSETNAGTVDAAKGETVGESPGSAPAQLSDSDSSDSDDADPDISVDERLVRAESCKLSGNSMFRDKDNKGAIKFYKRGVDLLKVLEDKKVGEILDGHVVKRDELFCSLLSNQAAACNREEMWKDSVKCATRALKFVKAEDTGTLTKLHFRRGTAHARLSDLDPAKKDFAKVLSWDPKNRPALKEYTHIRKKLAEIKAKERKGFGKAFSAGGMYGDKEDARKKREERERKQREQDKKDYEADKAKREKEGEPTISFEDWKDKKRREEEKKERLRREKEEKAEKEREARRLKEREERRKQEEANPTSDDVELDEEDLAAINEVKAKGYCHFRREQTEEEKELLKRSLTPSRIGDDSAEDGGENGAKNTTAHSAWNQAGTWEEKTVSDLAKTKLREALGAVVLKDDDVEITVSSVTNVSGDAQIVLVGGKRGTLYDMSLDVKWKATMSANKDILFDIDEDETDDDEDEGSTEARKTSKPETKTASGTLKFGDISNGVKGHHYECSMSWGKSTLGTEEQAALLPLLGDFERLVRDCIAEVVEKKLID